MKEYSTLNLEKNQTDLMVLDKKYISKFRFDNFSKDMIQIVPTKLLVLYIYDFSHAELDGFIEYLSSGLLDRTHIHLTLTRCSNFGESKFKKLTEIIFQLNLKKLTIIDLNPSLATNKFYDLILSCETL